mmetsp:Transcript_50958/g.119482  ORF Transcript_50958/g.119482 Transcript_50958/m.119482 type:complete len:231 (-) Transcript_50958:6585-7277(-)
MTATGMSKPAGSRELKRWADMVLVGTCANLGASVLVVEHAKHLGAAVLQSLVQLAHGFDPRLVAPRDNENGAAARGDDGSIRAVRRSRRVDHDVVELADQLVDQEAEGRPLNQLDRVGRRGADRQHEQVLDAGHLLDDLALGTPRQDIRETCIVSEPENLMQPRRAHVGVNKQRAPAELGQRHRQVGRDKGLAIADVGADDGQRAARALGTWIDAQDDLATQVTECFTLL